MKPTLSSLLTSLVTAREVAFTARTWIAPFDDEGKPQASLLPGQTFAVKARRPGSLRIEEIQTDLVMQEAIERAGHSIGTPFEVFVSDGTHQYELNTTSQVYIEGKAAPILAQIQTERGLPEMLGVYLLFAEEPLAGLETIGAEQIESVTVSIFAYTGSAGDGQRFQQRLYIAIQSGMPVRLSQFQAEKADEWAEACRTDFADWEFDGSFPDAVFDTTPPPDAKPEPPPSPRFDPHLQPGMEPAPLRCADLAGKPVSLDEYRGQVVLLDYWANWCVPCRKVMLWLKAVYEQFHPQGLEVIGISLDVDYMQERMRAFLQENEIPWRQVCDGKGFESPLATVYQVSAIPFTLLIGRDGKIAAVNARGDELEEAIRRALAQS